MFHTGTARIYACNGTAAVIWEGIAAGATIEAIARRVEHECDISKDRALEDTAALIQQLLVNKLISPRWRINFQDRIGWLTRLTLQAIWQLFRYDLEKAILGFGHVQKQLAVRPAISAVDWGVVGQVVKAVSVASLFYCRSVKCLQRSIATMRLLHKFDIPAEVVIGYRAVPFFSHAWVEVDGAVVNDSQVLASQLAVLHRI